MFLLRPGASRLKSRIILSISSAVGRPVDVGSVHIRLLPRPGFDLENLVVYDDPAYGAEPILRAWQVPFVFLDKHNTAADLAAAYRQAQAEGRAGAVLLAE